MFSQLFLCILIVFCFLIGSRSLLPHQVVSSFSYYLILSPLQAVVQFSTTLSFSSPIQVVVQFSDSLLFSLPIRLCSQFLIASCSLPSGCGPVKLPTQEWCTVQGPGAAVLPGGGHQCAGRHRLDSAFG